MLCVGPCPGQPSLVILLPSDDGRDGHREPANGQQLHRHCSRGQQQVTNSKCGYTRIRRQSLRQGNPSLHAVRGRTDYFAATQQKGKTEKYRWLVAIQLPYQYILQTDLFGLSCSNKLYRYTSFPSQNPNSVGKMSSGRSTLSWLKNPFHKSKFLGYILVVRVLSGARRSLPLTAFNGLLYKSFKHLNETEL